MRKAHALVSGITPGAPVWNAALWAEERSALPERLRKVTATYWVAILHYVRYPAGLLLHAGLCVVLALAFVGGAAADRSVAGGLRGGIACRHGLDYPPAQRRRSHCSSPPRLLYRHR